MKCPFCSFEFDESSAQSACSGCHKAGGGCEMVKCPRCGYEMPEEPNWAKRLRKVFGREKK